MNKIRVGIIGTGSISNYHIQAYKSDPRVELVAFCDINEERVRTMAEKYGVNKIYLDCRDMLKNERLDAVSVCTWNSAHAECSVAALDAGVNVLCEKPMAMSAGQGMQMKDAAEKSGKLLMIGFVRRYGNDCRILKDFIDKGYFGDIYYAKTTYLRRNGNPGGWFGDISRSGGGPLIDLGVHVIDLSKYLMGNPKPVSVYGATFAKLGNRPDIKLSRSAYRSATAKQNDICDVEDLASALIRFENGSVISVEASFSLNIKEDIGRIELFGTKAGCKIDPEIEMYSQENGYLTDVKLFAPTALDFKGLFESEISHYLDCVSDRSIKCVSPAADGVAMMKILDAIYLSAKTGHEVIL